MIPRASASRLIGSPEVSQSQRELAVLERDRDEQLGPAQHGSGAVDPELEAALEDVDAVLQLDLSARRRSVPQSRGRLLGFEREPALEVGRGLPLDRLEEV